MGFPEDKIYVVGNPEISQFINSHLTTKSEFLNQLGIKSTRYAVYLDDGLVANRLWTKQQWCDHLTEIAEILGKKDIFLIVKLHPRTNSENHIKFFDKYSSTMIAIQDIDFKNLLYHCDFSISFYSSTVIYALIFHKKVYIPKWDKPCRELTNKYPDKVVKYCFTLNDFNDSIKSDSIMDDLIIDDYLIKNGENKDYVSIRSIVNLIDQIGKY